MDSNDERDKEYVYHRHDDDLSEQNNTTNDSAFGLGGFSSSSPSDFSSPFGSEIGSTTESEDDDFISELNLLTRRMAEYTFQDDDEEDDEFHKIFTTDSVSKNFEAIKSNSSSVIPSESELAMNLGFSEIGSEQVLTDEQIKTIQVYELKNQPQQKKQGVIGHGGTRVNKSTENVKEGENMQNRGGKAWKKRMLNPPPPPPAAPPVSAGSGMRAVFLGGSNTRKGSSGTGVFLPTGTYASAEPPKRKPGSSTVLIPARVLQTLQQHFNNVGARSHSTSYPWQNDVLERINGLLSQQKEHAEFQTGPAVAETDHDQAEEVMKLPQEWTY